MIQDIAAHRIHAAQISSRTPSLGEGEYRAILGIFAVSLTLSIMAMIQFAINM